MDRKRKIYLAIFIVAGIASMWARYWHQKSERQEMEDRIRSLAQYEREHPILPSALASATPSASPEETVEETRDMFTSDLPRDYMGAIRQAVGADFKVMNLVFDDRYAKATVSTDGKSVKEFTLWRGKKNVEGPSDVNLIGDNPLADSLFELKTADLSLIPKLVREAVERSGIKDGRVTSASFAYPLIYNKGESPEWTIMVERGSPPDWEHKFVTFDAKGRFKSVS